MVRKARAYSRHRIRHLFLVITAAIFFAIIPALSFAEAFHEYAGACDGSAAVPLTPTMFLSATDENNVLRLYKIGHAGVLQSLNLQSLPRSFLRLEEKKKELDLEGAALLGDKVYWIASHSSGKEGKPAPNRRRLFSTKVSVGPDRTVSIFANGSAAYDSLIEDLNDAPGILYAALCLVRLIFHALSTMRPQRAAENINVRVQPGNTRILSRNVQPSMLNPTTLPFRISASCSSCT
jgi:hypothetical protein